MELSHDTWVTVGTWAIVLLVICIDYRRLIARIDENAEKYRALDEKRREEFKAAMNRIFEEPRFGSLPIRTKRKRHFVGSSDNLVRNHTEMLTEVQAVSDRVNQVHDAVKDTQADVRVLQVQVESLDDKVDRLERADSYDRIERVDALPR